MGRRKRNRNRQQAPKIGVMAETPEAAAEKVPGEPLDASCRGMAEETYFRERTILIEMEQKSSDQHDKAILTLTAGALGLSITFLDKIAADPQPDTLWLIGWSWLCFVFSIIGIVGSFLTSQAACRRQRDLLDSEFRTGEVGDQTNIPAKWTNRLNIAAYTLLVIGIGFLATFSWQNLPHKGDQMAGSSVSGSNGGSGNPSGQPDERGAVPPKRPVTSTKPTTSPNPKK